MHRGEGGLLIRSRTRLGRATRGPPTPVTTQPESAPFSASDAQGPAPGAASPVADLGWRETTRRLVAAIDVAAKAPHRWPAGLCYQFLALGWALGIAAAVPVVVRVVSPEAANTLGIAALRSDSAFDALTHDQWSVFAVVLLGLALRLAPGLARSLFFGEGQRPIERTYHLGRGFALSSAAIWIQVVLTMLVASTLAVLIASTGLRIVGSDPDGPLPKVVAGVTLGFLCAYGATLGALYHLALASLVRHRRGAGSALLHAWRLVRSQPSGAARAVALEGALYAAVAYLEWFLPQVLRLGGLSTLVVLSVSGLARAGFWSRTYHAFGGVEPVPPTGDEPRSAASVRAN